MADEKNEKAKLDAAIAAAAMSTAPKSLSEYGFKDEESMEFRRDSKPIKTGYPKPVKRFRLEMESENLNVEEPFYWMVGHTDYDFGFHEKVKITDSFATSAASGLFGDIQSRLGAQQSNVSTHLQTIGKLLRDLFGLVRELRQVEERLDYYAQSFDSKSKQRHQSDATLKDIWITLVEGGANNPSSVIGLARTVGFTVLPDLFFQAPVLKADEVDAHVKSLDFNESVKLKLKIKLDQFAIWKERTFQELKQTQRFKVRYLHQHLDVIRMYMEWVKPYLKNIRRLQFRESAMDDAQLINSFDSSISEIEILVKNKVGDVASGSKELKNSVYAVILFNFKFRAKPLVQQHQQHHRTIAHIGRVDCILRAYTWTGEEINNYVKYREQESFDVLKSLDASISEAMTMLGEDMVKFLLNKEINAGIPSWLATALKDRDGVATKKKAEEKQASGLSQTWDLVKSPFEGLSQVFSPLIGIEMGGSAGWKNPFSAKPSKEEEETAKLAELKAKAFRTANGAVYQTFKNYKKAHRMIAW